MAYDSKWWSMRSGDLVGSNTITQEISDSIKKFFSKKDGKAGSIFLIILSLIAFHFGIEGYKLILSKFMGDIPSVGRMIIALIPMGVGCYLFYLAFFNKFDSKVYMEASAALCIILMGMTISSLGAELSFLSGAKGLFYLMFLSIPVIYLATSTVGAFLFLYTLLSWLGGAHIIGAIMGLFTDPMMAIMRGGGLDGIGSLIMPKSGESIFGWFFLLLILPHFMRYTDRPSFDTRKLVLGWIGGMLLIQIALGSITSYTLIAFPFLMVIFYMAGKEYFADGAFWWNRPFQTMTIAIFALLSIVLSMYPQANMGLYAASGLEGSSPNGWFAWIINLFVVLGILAWAGYTVYNDFKSDKKANILLVAFPAVLLLTFLLEKSMASIEGFKVGAWIFTLYTLALGADYLMKGIAGKDYKLIALGLVIGVPVLMFRVNDLLSEALNGENGMLLRGLILIGLCGGLLYVAKTYYNETTPSEE